jgi:hypothetical protein
VGEVAADYLRHGREDLKSNLYHNNGDGTFADVSHAAHVDKIVLAMGSNYGDLDNDGFLDFYLGTGTPDLTMLIPNRMFRNAGGKSFQDVTSSGGFGHLQKGHGVSFGDIDNDGDQDIYEDMGGAFRAIRPITHSTRIPATATTGLCSNPKVCVLTGRRLEHASK